MSLASAFAAFAAFASTAAFALPAATAFAGAVGLPSCLTLAGGHWGVVGELQSLRRGFFRREGLLRLLLAPFPSRVEDAAQFVGFVGCRASDAAPHDPAALVTAQNRLVLLIMLVKRSSAVLTC